MEVDEIQTQPCKFPRIGNGRVDSSKIGQKDQNLDEEEDGEHQYQLQRASTATAGGLGGDDNRSSGANRLRGWQHSSRIIRVSRASGGKDRHSKVWTSKGLRDRRVRLSVTTAIQFYDLQDRLGYDQPSKAVEWLIKAAADSISELPSLNSSFPDTPRQLSDEKRASEGTDQQGFDSVELDGDPNYQQNQSQHRSLSKSACSSNSETSKGSGLSLSRSEIRVNRVKGARERAKERSAAKEKVKENESRIFTHHHVNPNTISQSSSFTELLTCGIGSVNNNNSSPAHQDPNGEPFFPKPTAARQWSATSMDYFNTGLIGPSSSRPHNFSGQIQAMSFPSFSLSNENVSGAPSPHQRDRGTDEDDKIYFPIATYYPGRRNTLCHLLKIRFISLKKRFKNRLISCSLLFVNGKIVLVIVESICISRRSYLPLARALSGRWMNWTKPLLLQVEIHLGMALMKWNLKNERDGPALLVLRLAM